MGCRNTVFNAQAQSGADFVPQLAAAGVGSLRVELVDEPAELVAPLLEGYRAVAAGERSARDLMEWMQGLPDSNGAWGRALLDICNALLLLRAWRGGRGGW